MRNMTNVVTPVKKRDASFDFLKALGAILIVADHSGYCGFSAFTNWFPTHVFVVELFLFVSGYFFKESQTEKKGKYVLNQIVTLLLPFILYNFFYAFIVFISRRFGFSIGADFNLKNMFLISVLDAPPSLYNLAAWFVLPFFVIKVIHIFLHWLLRLLIKNDRIVVVIFFVLYIGLGIFGHSLSIKGQTTGWWLPLCRVLHLLPFYGLGLFYKKFEEYDKLPNAVYFLICFLCSLVFMLWFGRVPNFLPGYVGPYTEGPVMPIIVGFVCILFWLRLARVLRPVYENTKMVKLIGGATFSIMMNQFLAFMVVKFVFMKIYEAGVYMQDFDVVAFKSNLWYFYLPNGMKQCGIFYLLAGVLLPVGMQQLINLIKKPFQKLGKKVN